RGGGGRRPPGAVPGSGRAVRSCEPRECRQHGGAGEGGAPCALAANSRAGRALHAPAVHPGAAPLDRTAGRDTMTSDLSSAGAATGDATTAPRRARARGPGAFRRLASFAFGTLLALGAEEVAVRVIDPLGRVRFESYFEDADRNRVDYATALARGLVVEPG